MIDPKNYVGQPSFLPNEDYWESSAQSGDGDGNTEFFFEIAGIPLRACSPEAFWRPDFDPFRLKPRPDFWRHSFHVFSETQHPFFVNPSDYPDRGPAIRFIRDPLCPRVFRDYGAACFDWDKETTRIAVIDDMSLRMKRFMMEVFVKEALVHQGISWELLFFHGTALMRDGGAWVFFGPSGAGKSTVSGYGDKNGFTVLNDEMIAFRFEGGVLKVWGTPLGGSFRARGGVPVKAFFRLRQAARNAVRPLPRKEALRELALSAQTGDLRSPEILENSFDFLDKAQTFMPCYDLEFTKGPCFLDEMLRVTK